ncbi:MAG TPA: amidohydrolase [Gemmatimonadaceae bacterium]|nr:amidohydrolase [Gemmatimonadaceae bacterium]
MGEVLLHDADYVVQSAEHWAPRTSVHIESDRISAVGAARDLLERFPAARRIDCRGRILIPGLINAHNHLYQILVRGLGKRWRLEDWKRRLTYPLARGLSTLDYETAVRLAAMDSLRSGTTAIVDMPTHYARAHRDVSMSALREIGLRGAVVGSASDTSTGESGENSTRAEELASLSTFLERWKGSSTVQPWIGPAGFHAASPELMVEMKRLATVNGTRFHLHLGETEESMKSAQGRGHDCEVAWAGALDLLDERTSVAHAVWTSRSGRQRLASSRAQVVHNPNSNQVLASGVAPLRAYREAGIPIALGTDGPASNDSLDLISEMKSAVLLQRVHARVAVELSAGEAFSMCTEGGARVLGIERLGRLEAGWLADVVAIQVANNPCLAPLYDPVESLVYHGSGRDVVLTIVGGRVLYEDGRFTTVDADAVLSAAREAAARVRARLM